MADVYTSIRADDDFESCQHHLMTTTRCCNCNRMVAYPKDQESNVITCISCKHRTIIRHNVDEVTFRMRQIAELMNPRCPGCDKVFLEFDACAAVTCTCGCHFCGLCFTPCLDFDDCHDHVAQCSLRPPNDDLYFFSQAAIRAVWESQWHNKIIELLGMISDMSVREDVYNQMQPLLAGSSIRIERSDVITGYV